MNLSRYNHTLKKYGNAELFVGYGDYNDALGDYYVEEIELEDLAKDPNKSICDVIPEVKTTARSYNLPNRGEGIFLHFY